jgi:hypothetical protein
MAETTVSTRGDTGTGTPTTGMVVMDARGRIRIPRGGGAALLRAHTPVLLT